MNLKALKTDTKALYEYLQNDSLNIDVVLALTKSIYESAKEEEKYRFDFDKPITECDLSYRTQRCLVRGGIKTLNELCDKTAFEIQNIQTLGKKSFKEIREFMAKNNLHFKG